MRNHPPTRWIATALLLILLSAPSLAQEPAASAEPNYLPIAPAAWCLILDTEPETPEADEDPGCDAGIAAVLYRFRFEPRLSIVGALGTWSLGPGLGWTFYRSTTGTAYGVAVGLVVPWSEAGIDMGDPGVAVGATLSLARAGRGD